MSSSKWRQTVGKLGVVRGSGFGDPNRAATEEHFKLQQAAELLARPPTASGRRLAAMEGCSAARFTDIYTYFGG